MSNANQETIADIVGDIRAQNQGLPEDSYALSPLVCDLLSLADRIEAAAKRECEATSEKSSAVGNAAAMLEALYAITLIDTRMLKRLLCELVEADILDGGQIRNTIHAVEKARQAIAAPPRNCDVGTAEEQIARFNKFCFPIKCSECQLHTDEDLHDCIFRWAQMPYEEGGES